MSNVNAWTLMPAQGPRAGPRARAQRPNLSELAAAKLIESHGRKALSIIEERAELAEELGHKIAARTWRDMANAAARLLRIERHPAPLSGTSTQHRQPWLR